ncbi:hypothetical protein J7E79_30555 [Bacillus sp. ISL-40]|uniref:hypothetical protein n=1 Tax=unclassified Bacillus (in: firmicutes) TaxID=185979 RepID=UPI001BEB283A|nr:MULTISPECIES: hypothetical protein [unclassified Bacillus (in: firmicutes)]MBT2701592.1 hypothetical protein [Bacillus sp. ISL-40]MBT2744709.1 hypothetical protein [Bacillus sp. ISL-77]
MTSRSICAYTSQRAVFLFYSKQAHTQAIQVRQGAAILSLIIVSIVVIEVAARTTTREQSEDYRNQSI